MKKITKLIALLTTLSLFLTGCGETLNNDSPTTTSESTSFKNENEPTSNTTINNSSSESSTAHSLQIDFLDVGQGDCTILTCDGHSMLIDAGENDKGSSVAAYLKSKGITTLDIVVGTHNDSDHIGGLDVILYQFDCKNVILSKFAKDNRTYDDVIQTCKNKNYKIQYPEANTTYALGDATITILSDPNYKADSANNSSISLLITHHENTFLFTGDSEEDAEYELLKNNKLTAVDVLHAGHHGSKSSTTDEFLNKTLPSYTVISCGENNSYGHPHAQTLNKIRSSKIKMFRTDKQGTISVSSDGKNLIWNMSESDDWTPGEYSSSSTTKPNISSPDSSNISLTYILNTNTKKIHLETCEHAKSIKEKNKQTTTDNIENLIKQGYLRCKSCNP